MRTILTPFVFIIGLLTGITQITGGAATEDLERRFADPPEGTKPRCYWYWIDGQISREGITRDLEAMKRVGIGEGYIGIIGGGEVRALTEEWWQLVEHAIREGGRLGVDIGLFNCPGWSQSGGPWVKPSQAMRYLAMPEVRLRGPQRFAGKLPAPAGEFQDVAVVAFPAPSGESETAETRGAKITKSPEAVTYAFPEPFTARSVVIRPAQAINVQCDLQVSDDGAQFRSVRKFAVDRHNLSVNVGPVPLAPIAIAFPATTARYFRLAFSSACNPGEISLMAAARLESYAEQQLIKVFQDPQPPFDFYQWPPQAEPESIELTVRPEAVKDLGGKLEADGTLRWEVPAGDWIVLRTAMVPTGTSNSPAPPEASGPEVDKMSRPALKAHFDAYLGEVLRRVPAAERRALKHVVADSYEMGPQNWTDDFAVSFRRRYGYDPLRFLPAMTGRVVGSAEQSSRFLWDLRRLVADRVARDYVGGLRDLCHEHGLKMWLENYGHWGFPGEFLQYGGACDELSGEFWATGNLGSIELRDAASAAHIYGKPAVFAEAFTGGPLFTSHPASLKARGDWAYCEGINQFVLHVYIQQPWEDRRPGVSAWFGTEFNRHNTWFEDARPWIDYQRRCSVLLQHGRYVADVAYFIGEDTPKMAGRCQPPLPPGYAFDYINAEVIESRLQVKNGRFVLPDGMSYRLLVLPESTTMRPGLLKRLRDLVGAGGAIYGAPPKRSPSLENYPACDAEVRQLAAEVWEKPGNQDRVFREGDLSRVLERLDTPPDLSGVDPARILFVHRTSPEAEIYFISNQSHRETDICPSFRVEGRTPELWDPETGRREQPAVYEVAGKRVRVPLHLGPAGSIFVVFRHAAVTDSIVSVTREGKPVVDTKTVDSGTAPSTGSAGTFTLAMWVKPAEGTPLFKEANQGVVGMAEGRNDVLFPQHGDSFVAGGGHAGCGLAVGTNGVCVFEHGASYFAPVLVHAVPLAGWTHVAVVYRDNRPSLYINGELAHTGLQSRHVVHPTKPETASAKFRGELGEIRLLGQALTVADLMKLQETRPESGSRRGAPPIELTRKRGGRIAARVWEPGTYTLKSASGRSSTVTVATVPEPIELEGAWEVHFPAESGLKAPVTFEGLRSWTEQADPLVKYFSGAATYRKKFEIPGDRLGKDQQLFLDLGRVEVMAEVVLNGRSLGRFWKRPFLIEITDAARAGSNELEVRVVNVWHNRLVGQVREPEAFAAARAPKPWVSTPPQLGPRTPLFPAGLIGPVCLRSVAGRDL